MRDTTVSRSYAAALFELGDKHERHEAFAQGMRLIEALLDSDPRVRTFLETPKIAPSVKKNVLKDALGAKIDALLLNFVMLVVDKRRQRLLAGIAHEYRGLLDEKMGRLNVELTLAHEPDEAEVRSIAAQLSRILAREVVPHVRVDEDILGGVVVRYRDRVIDGSLRRRLIALRHRLLDTTVGTSA